MYNYIVYGLKVKSDIEIKEFMKSENENNDIGIVLGQVPKGIKEMISEGSRGSYSKSKVWFHIDNIATYYITDGKNVLVEPCDDPDETLLRVYLMCSCLGLIMLQREQVAIHGGVINIDGNAVIFTGDRGAGKSTLTTALRERGYKFISDDVAGIKIDKVPYVMPGFPYQKLCESAMNNFGYDKEAFTSFMSDKEVKYIVPAKDEFIYEPKELTVIVKLTVGDVDEVTIEELRGSEKLNNIIQNIYRGEYIKHLGKMDSVYFKQCIDIAKNIRFFKVTRPANQFTVDTQINLIEREIISAKEIVV